MDLLDLYRVMRPVCSECGAGGLDWIAGRAAMNLALLRGLDMSGVLEVLSTRAVLGWFCTRCEGCGLFGDLEFEDEPVATATGARAHGASAPSTYARRGGHRSASYR